MNRFIIAGNWKMNMKKGDVKNFFDNMADLPKNVTKIICPSFPMIPFAMAEAARHDIQIGAQNVSECAGGAYTGDVSASILKSIGVNYCIIGHSERRQFYHDLDVLIGERFRRLRGEGINPIICVGETHIERDQKQTFNVIKKTNN